MQKIWKQNYSEKDKLEAESYSGVRSMPIRETGAKDGADLFERILERNNLNRAYKQVKRNGGAPGVDGMSVDDLLAYLREHKDGFLESLRDGTYRPLPVRRVEIPKPDGGVRLLGVPAVMDRMIQQAISQVLSPIFEQDFSETSYGFRPGRSAHQAIRKAQEYYNQGYRRVVDIDLSKYFDTINHELLMEMLRTKISDKRVLSLIKRYLKSGVMINGIVSATNEGSPQGGNLSPLLSNIYLTSFDRELERRGHKFVRYADDVNIYVKSQRAAERVLASSRKFLETKLKLKVNESKSMAGSPLKLKFLGFALRSTTKGQAGIRVHEKSIDRFKAKVRELTRRNQGNSVEYMLHKLRQYTIGWLGYYAIADMKSFMQRSSEWIRRKIRTYVWKQWKRVRTRFDRLQKLGIHKGKAWEWANTRKGYWRIADSWILHRSLTNQRIADMGYDDISIRYNALHSNY
ncbi:MAG: group II intron reverse transcriptase/maturase [Victivallales bacterium]|nr:group II intron reverse transcriptase/maturase [Victivallales bacterium]